MPLEAKYGLEPHAGKYRVWNNKLELLKEQLSLV